MSLAFGLALGLITALAFMGLPMGAAMITGSIFYLLMRGQDMGIVAEQFLNGMYSNYIMLAVPLFILAAEIMNSGTLSERLLKWCDAVVGRFRGGLAQVNILQSIVFAGMSGSAIADAAGSGKMMQYMMTKDGKYTPSYAAALTAATAVIGPIIPPSIPMVLYALVADASIGYLFLGGIVGIIGFFLIPVVGLVLGFVLGVFVVERVRQKDNALAWQSTKHALKAAGVSMLIELATALIIAGIWIGGVALLVIGLWSRGASNPGREPTPIVEREASDVGTIGAAAAGGTAGLRS